MSLHDRLRGAPSSPTPAAKNDAFGTFGLAENPFPAAGQTSGHPRLEDEADNAIVDAIQAFEKGTHASQVIVLRGTQGVGKTNFLGAYESQLRDLYKDDSRYFVIRYYADPEPAFDAVLRSVLSELGVPHLHKVASALQTMAQPERDNCLGLVRSVETRVMFRRLIGQVSGSEHFDLALEWLLGLRVLNRHREVLGISYRLDTVESRTQALRDIVCLSARLGQLNGMYLLLDELEKQAGTLGKSHLIRYLFALRALIDALPEYLFLVLAMTPSAFFYYNRLIPAFTSRLQTTIDIRPIGSEESALALYKFYVDKGREADRVAEATRAAAEGRPIRAPGQTDPISVLDVGVLYRKLADKARGEGVEGGVLHRDFLHSLHAQYLDAVNRLSPAG